MSILFPYGCHHAFVYIAGAADQLGVADNNIFRFNTDSDSAGQWRRNMEQYFRFTVKQPCISTLLALHQLGIEDVIFVSFMLVQVSLQLFGTDTQTAADSMRF